MSFGLNILMLAAVAGSLSVVVRHHIGYLRRERATTFGAFLDTAGWIVLTLVALGALAGGLTAPGTRRAELSSALVGALFIGAGRRIG